MDMKHTRSWLVLEVAALIGIAAYFIVAIHVSRLHHDLREQDQKSATATMDFAHDPEHGEIGHETMIAAMP